MKKVGFYGTILLKKFKKLDLSITYRCNSRCKICNIWQIYQKNPSLVSQEINLAGYKNFFSKYNFWNWVSLTGGEPFLREDLADIVEIISKSCERLYALSIPTNGLSGQEIAKKIKEILKRIRCRLYINISLDGDEKTHNHLKGIESAFGKARALFEDLKKVNDKKLEVKYEYVISRLNQGRLPDFFREGSFNTSDFHLSLAQKSFRYNNQNLAEIIPEQEAAKRDTLYFLAHYKVKSFFDFHQKTFLKLLLKGAKISCVAGKNTFYMDPYGNIFLCTLLDKGITFDKKNIGVKKNTEPNLCKGCYTPCESYFGLALGSRIELLKNIFRLN